MNILPVAGGEPALPADVACGPCQWPLFAGYGPLGALPTAPSIARSFVTQTLRAWGTSDWAEPCELVISELATNVVRAAREPDGCPRYGSDGRLPEFCVRLLSDRRWLRAEVWDTVQAAFGTPAPRHADPADESGRGLVIVEAITDHWGWDEIPGWRGKRVWALFGTR